jgi:hypothetical protein
MGRLSATDTVGITDLVDVNSIQRVGDIYRYVWDMILQITTWEPPYDAPMELKIEHYLYNCKTHQGDVSP